MLIKRLLQAFSVLSLSALLVSCGGGGGGAAGGTALPSLTYQAGVTIGDNGVLEIDRVNLRYSLTIQNSSFSLTGKTFTGAITPNTDGGYNIVGTTYGRIFIYDNYSVMTLKADPNDQDFAEYFRRNPAIRNTVYIPIFALKKESLLSTVDAVTSNGQSLEFRSAFMGSEVVAASIPYTRYEAEMRIGKITKVSNTVFTVDICSNDGASATNYKLTKANVGHCESSLSVVAPAADRKTFTYNAAEGAWLMTPVDPDHLNQVVRAYFVADTGTNQIIGYIDTSDTTGNSAGFAIAAVVPTDNPIPLVESGLPYTLVSYQLCSSDSNCAKTELGNTGVYENGIYTETNVTSSSPVTTRIEDFSGNNTGRNCMMTSSDNVPTNGLSQNVWGVTSPPSDACTSPGDRPDGISFMFGSQIQSNGKFRSLVVSLGYDTTVSPSQKISIINLFQN